MNSDAVHQFFADQNYSIKCAYVMADPVSGLNTGNARVVLMTPSLDSATDIKSRMALSRAAAKNLVTTLSGRFLTRYPLEIVYDPFGYKLLHEMAELLVHISTRHQSTLETRTDASTNRQTQPPPNNQHVSQEQRRHVPDTRNLPVHIQPGVFHTAWL
jgi:hypothetical protein